MALREKVTEAMLHHYPIPDAQRNPNHPFYYQDYANNLFCPMGEQAYQAYLNGDGDELIPKEKLVRGKQVITPPKMASIASSSAMTFNLLGNDSVVVSANHPLPAGTYEVQYEKKMYTICAGTHPANLDAFLSNETDRTAIFCEMKMLEWLNPPSSLSDTYLCNRYYFSSEKAAVNFPKDAFSVFQEVIAQIKLSAFQRYDAWQMLKHLLAIYNYTSFTTQTAVNHFRDIPSMAGKYNRIILANVINEFPLHCIDDDRVRAQYASALREEHHEAAHFIDIIRCSEIPHLFDNNCNAGIYVHYLSSRDFADCLDMPKAKRDYLKRYFP